MSLGGARGGGDGAAGEGGGRKSGDALGVVGKGPAPWELLMAGAGAGQPRGQCPRGVRRTTAPRQSENITPSNAFCVEPRVYARVHFLFIRYFNSSLCAFQNIRKILPKDLENKRLHRRPSIFSPDPAGFSHTHLPEGQTPRLGS